MGIGDDLMFLGEAELVHKETGKKITPVHGTGWSSLFDNVDFLVRNGGLTVNARDTKQKSDVHIEYYVKEKRSTILGEKLILQNYKPKPFKVRLYQSEMSAAEKILEEYDLKDFIIVNPDYKSSFFSDNKNWGFKKWQRLTDMLSEHMQVVRLHPDQTGYKEPLLKNAINIKNSQIRSSIALMSKSKFGVTYDGLLQHVFAGFRIPAVVIQGGLVNEKIMSYDTNLHISYDHPETPCGSTFYCPHCVEANKAITVDMVYEKCLKLL